MKLHKQHLAYNSTLALREFTSVKSLCDHFSKYFVSNAKESLEKMKHCVMAVTAGMTGSKLKLNPSKTDFLRIGTKLNEKNYYMISHV